MGPRAGWGLLQRGRKPSGMGIPVHAWVARTPAWCGWGMPVAFDPQNLISWVFEIYLSFFFFCLAWNPWIGLLHTKRLCQGKMPVGVCKWHGEEAQRMSHTLGRLSCLGAGLPGGQVQGGGQVCGDSRSVALYSPWGHHLTVISLPPEAWWPTLWVTKISHCPNLTIS